MPSAGQLLREERLKRKRSVSDIATETCICSRYLEAIEEDNLKVLPGDFFYRSFIKQYAQALQLDAQTSETILGSMERIEEPDPVPALSAGYQVAEIDARNNSLNRAPVSVALGLLAAVVIGCSGLYAIWQAQTDKVDQQETSQTPPAPIPEPVATIEPQPAIRPAVQMPSHPGTIQVNLTATEPTWVSLSSAGKTVFSGVIDASQTKNFAVNEEAKVVTGNAAGLDVRLNGRPIGPIGPRGTVRVVVLSQDDYEIRTPRKL